MRPSARRTRGGVCQLPGAELLAGVRLADGPPSFSALKAGAEAFTKSWNSLMHRIADKSDTLATAMRNG